MRPFPHPAHRTGRADLPHPLDLPVVFAGISTLQDPSYGLPRPSFFPSDFPNAVPAIVVAIDHSQALLLRNSEGLGNG
jgi:hypothetical protein